MLYLRCLAIYVMTAADRTLKVLAVVIGFLVISSRFPGFIWPDRFKNVFKKYISLGNGVYRAVGALLITLAVSLFYLVTSHSPERNPARLAGLCLGITLLGIGWLHLHPELLRRALSSSSSRLGGRFGALLADYSSTSKAGIVTIAFLIISTAIGILYITHLPVTPEKFIVLYCAFIILLAGVVHFYPDALRKIASKVAFRSSATIRWTSLVSTIVVLIVIIWALLSPD